VCGDEVVKKAAQDAADGDMIVGSFDPDDPAVRRARSVPGVYVDDEEEEEEEDDDDDDDDDDNDNDDKHKEGLSSAAGGERGR
jgi:hypothetical protein